MLYVLIYSMIFLGAGLMVFNIFGFIKFARDIRSQESWDEGNMILYIPVVLLTMFLAGYLAVGFFGKPDLIIAGILFFGSVFVFIMYRLLSSITQKIREKQQMEAKLIAAEQSNLEKTEFLASISHEMRTPMNVIMGLDNMILKQEDLSPETKDYLERINLSAKHLMGLIDNILDMKRIESGSMELREDVFSLDNTLDQMNAIVETACDNKGLTFEKNIAEPEHGWLYKGDEIKLRHILISILDNAVKYTDVPGKVIFSFSQTAEENGIGTLRFDVEDTGVGIDKSFIPKVFDMFSKEDSSFTGRFGGSGLSLSVAKNMVEMMDGTITLESEKNVGTVFTVTVPMRCTDPAEEKRERSYESISLEGKRVLIVEDINENAEIVKDLLELEDVKTERAENGQIALDMIGSSKTGYYDAILMDLRMPVMDGLEATRRIRDLEREDTKTVPIIALTANAFESDVQDTMNAGMDAHLAKPTDVEVLYDTLKRYIAKAEK